MVIYESDIALEGSTIEEPPQALVAVFDMSPESVPLYGKGAIPPIPPPEAAQHRAPSEPDQPMDDDMSS